jgi:hypothetical protein
VQQHARKSFRTTGLIALTQIKAAPQPAAARALLLPTIQLLQWSGELKEAAYLAQLAINTFPRELSYRLALARIYRIMTGDHCTGKRPLKKAFKEYNFGMNYATDWQRIQISYEKNLLQSKCITLGNKKSIDHTP